MRDSRSRSKHFRRPPSTFRAEKCSRWTSCRRGRWDANSGNSFWVSDVDGPTRKTTDYDGGRLRDARRSVRVPFVRHDAQRPTVGPSPCAATRCPTDPFGPGLVALSQPAPRDTPVDRAANKDEPVLSSVRRPVDVFLFSGSRFFSTVFFFHSSLTLFRRRFYALFEIVVIVR